MSGFRRRSDDELSRLSDDALVGYIGDARDAGEAEAMQRGIEILAYGLRGDVVVRVRRKLESRSDADVEIVADQVIAGAMLAAFRGESVGEFRALLNRILARRVADYYRSRRGGAREGPLPSEHAGDDEVWGDEPRAQEEISGIWADDAVERALADLSPAHRAVIELRLAGYTSKEAAEIVNVGDELPVGLETPMTADNVDQINSRFRHRLRDLLEEAERSGDPSQDPSENDDD